MSLYSYALFSWVIDMKQNNLPHTLTCLILEEKESKKQNKTHTPNSYNRNNASLHGNVPLPSKVEQVGKGVSLTLSLPKSQLCDS
jgi:hypothetical protein